MGLFHYQLIIRYRAECHIKTITVNLLLFIKIGKKHGLSAVSLKDYKSYALNQKRKIPDSS